MTDHEASPSSGRVSFLLILALMVAVTIGGLELYRGLVAPEADLPEYRAARAEFTEGVVAAIQADRARGPASEIEDPKVLIGRLSRLTADTQALEKSHSERVSRELPAWRRRHLIVGLALLIIGGSILLNFLRQSLGWNPPASVPSPGESF
jgi:hypothetical protein